MEESKRNPIRAAVGLLKREAVFICSQKVPCPKGATVILSRAYGIDWGTVVGSVEDTGQEIAESVIRIASDEDYLTIDSAAPAEEDFKDYNSYVEECGLTMKLVGIDHSFDRSKVTFYFVAEGRVDFRELVRLLNRKYQRRVELYQLNLEEQYRMFPSCGICGCELCCQKIKGLFGVKVPSRACKDQKLVYNPLKMSGCCGKARCCFLYEHANYAEYAEKLPRIGGRLEYRGHEWKLADWDVFRRAVLLHHPEYELDYAVPWDEFKVYYGEGRADHLDLRALFGDSALLRDRDGARSRGGNGGRKRSEASAGVSERYDTAASFDKSASAGETGEPAFADDTDRRFPGSPDASTKSPAPGTTSRDAEGGPPSKARPQTGHQPHAERPGQKLRRVAPIRGRDLDRRRSQAGEKRDAGAGETAKREPGSGGAPKDHQIEPGMQQGAAPPSGSARDAAPGGGNPSRKGPSRPLSRSRNRPRRR